MIFWGGTNVEQHSLLFQEKHLKIKNKQRFVQKKILTFSRIFDYCHVSPSFVFASPFFEEYGWGRVRYQNI